MEHNVVLYEAAAGVATITLNRPERLNSWTGRMNLGYRAALAKACADPAVRVIVVTGAGRGFCSGADSDALAGHAVRGAYDDGLPDEVPTPGWGVRPEFDAELAYHLGIAKPVIAAVNGPAAGLGFALMCWCDLRFAAAGAKLTSAHGRLGLPAEFGLSWLLPKIVGLTHAADILLSSRIFLAEEALRMGLLNAVLPPDELLGHAHDYARQLAETVAPSSLAATKRQLYRDLLTADPAASVRDAEATMTVMMGEPDYREGVAALREKRQPRYSPSERS
jgi:enoyl-CoA hydratase/carnithine racemase